MSRLENYCSDDDQTKQQLQQFDDLVDDGVICISDTESIPDTQQPKPPELTQLPATLQYPDGVVRLTRMVDSPLSPDVVTLDQLIRKPEVEKVLVTSFVLDMDWLLRHFNETTKVVVVAHSNNREEKPGVYTSESGRVMVIRPSFNGLQWSIMHSKIMLLFCKGYMRLVVSSANFFSIDWTVLQNIVFIQDFPLLENAPQGCEFGRELVGALRDLQVPEQVIEQVRKVDFSSARARIVTSVPSKLPLERKHLKAYGLARLHQVAGEMRRKINPVKANTWFDTTLYCYGSSMGKLTSGYLCDLYLCALGSSLSEYRRKTNRDDAATQAAISQNVNIGFHTQDQANQNRFGDVPRECIKFRSTLYFDETYMSSRLHKVTPVVDRVLMHAKVMVARYGETNKENGWLYLGSHNCTPAAWGYVDTTRNATTRIKYLNNFEFGVVLPEVTFESMFGRDTVTWNGAKVPLPFKLKWEPYGQMDLPCMNME
ncbi:hypothetical protein GGF40_003035 [Coemansia sp. RSA 1286]|nr:hypothetical protein GGF40_003035 [Coemansia sp. RSA 1286]